MRRIECLRYRYAAITLLLLTAVVPAAESQTMQQATVVRVTDGDTVKLRLPDGRRVNLRLFGIDAPELSYEANRVSQPHADRARAALRKLFAKQRRISYQKTNDLSHGREVGTLYLNGENLNQKMVQLGYAWAYRRYLVETLADEQQFPRSELYRYLRAEREARTAQRGLWQEYQPLPPGCWRRVLNEKQRLRIARSKKINVPASRECKLYHALKRSGALRR